MDKKYIDALQNLANAFDSLIGEMREKDKNDDSKVNLKSFTTFGTTLKSISTGIKKIQKDNKKMLSNQDTLLQMGQEIKDAKEKKNIFSNLTDKDNKAKIKDGTKTIVLIAGAVLAIGMAFKLLGKVDFMSVMALSLSLPLLALAFAKVAEHKELSGGEIVKVLVTIVGIAAAITLSSFILGMIKPIGLMQILTAIGIAAAFAVIGYGIAGLAKSVQGMTMKDLLFIPLAMVAISGAIMLSSFILNQTQTIPGDTLFNIVLLSGTLALSTTFMMLPMYLINKSGMGIKDLLFGGLAIIVLSGVIMVSSLLLSLGTYENYPGLGWALGVGLSLAAFSIPMIALGFIAASGIGALALIAGAIAVLGVAATIVGVSEILSAGDYSTYPSLGWSMGVGLSLAAFGMGMVVLGGIIVASFGLGGLALAAGAAAVLTVAQTIVDVSYILKSGNYTGGPTKQWAEGVGIAIGAFAPVFKTIMDSQVMSIFGGDAMTGKQYSQTMKDIGQAIVDVAGVFNAGGVSTWANAPTKEWAEGVGLAIGAFAPIYAIMDESLGDKLMSLFFGKEDKAKKMSDAMVTIAGSIIAVADVFNKSKVQYTGGPDRSWAEGVGQSIAHFSQVYAMLEDSDLDAGDILSLRPAVLLIAANMAEVGFRFNNIKMDSKIDPDFMKNFLSNIDSYLEILEKLEDADVDMEKMTNTSMGLMVLATGYEKLASSVDKLSRSLSSLQENQLEGLKLVTGNILSLSVIDADAFEKVMDQIADKSATLKDLFTSLNKEMDQKKNAISLPTTLKTGTSMSSSSKGNVQDMAISDLYSKLEEMNQKLGTIASNSSNLSSYVNELRAGGNVTLQH